MIPIEQLPKEAAGVMRRVIDTFFHDPSKAMKEVHVLDLADDGYIERHVDSLKVVVLGLRTSHCGCFNILTLRNSFRGTT